MTRDCRKGRKWQHEDASEMMFDDMVKKYNIDLPPEDVLFIKALIAGDRTRCPWVYILRCVNDDVCE